MKKRIALLGSTGSIGVQTLEVVAELSDLLELEVLTAYSNADLLIRQAKQFNPNVVVIGDESKYQYVKDALWNDDIKVFAGKSSLCDVVQMGSVDIVLSAIVGIAGLQPIYRAIEHKKVIALANKETLVVAGELMMKTAAAQNVAILPVDSEHSAIFQSIVGEHYNNIEKLIITASGGPFRGRNINFLQNVTPEEALKHPSWTMGNKITIDSATLMNKGFEVIEAKWLFNVPLEKIEVLIHPQSVIHSLVQFEDGSLKAQLGVPSMKLPIQYALTFPFRIPNTHQRLDFEKYASFTFEHPDYETFPLLRLAYQVAEKGGNAPAVLNAANEVAVAMFLQGKIKFLQINSLIEKALEKIPFSKPTTIEEYLEVDKMTRNYLLSNNN